MSEPSRHALLTSVALSLLCPTLAHASDDDFAGASGAVINGNVLLNDASDAAPVLNFGPRNGAVTLFETGDFTYTPAEGFEGVDGFVYVQETEEGPVASLVRLFSGSFQIVSASETTAALRASGVADRSVVGLGSRDRFGTVSTDTLWTADTVDGNLVFRTALSPEGRGSVLETWQPAGRGEDVTVYRRNDLPWQQFSLAPSAGNNDHIVSAFTNFRLQTADGGVTAAPGTRTLADDWLFAGARQDLAPTGSDDLFTGEVDQIISGRVSEDDTSNEGDFATFLITRPQNGEFVGINQSVYEGLSPRGAFDYQPDPGFEGRDTFTYVALGSSSGALSKIVTVTLEVGDVSEPAAPSITRSDVFVTAQDTEFSGSVALNDENIEGVVIVDPPVYGRFVGTVTPTGTFAYAPPAGFQGLDAFAYRTVRDGAASDVATAFVIVGEVKVASRTGDARNQLVLTAAADSNRADVALGADGRGDPLQTFALSPAFPDTDDVQAPNAAYTFALDRTVLETWQPDAAGTDATVFVPNQRPWQRFALAVNEDDGSLSITSGYTGRALAASAAAVGADVGTAEPAADENLQRWIVSGPGQTAPATGRDDRFTVAAGEVLSGRVLTNDDSNEFDLGAILVEGPSNGAFIGINQDIYGGLAPFGAFDYRPDEGFVGEDRFVYRVFGSANGAPSRYVTVRISVTE